ncbi:MAG: hypothetical protein WDZ56_00805 [Candidatus Paceibacterota bacterium]
MGTVHLTGSHHGLYLTNNKVDLKQRVLLTPEMLVRPIYNGDHPNTSQTQHVIRGALQGLMDLSGFNAAISYRAVERDGVPHLATPKRVWGEITLETPRDIVLGFSHDSRYLNHPYSSLLQWLEEDYPSGALTSNEFAEFCLGWASPERWRQLFEDRIQQKVETVRSKVDALRQETQSMAKRADAIEAVLG